MCDWGDTVPVRVHLPADLSSSGESRWAVKQIDKCIAPLVAALQEKPKTRGSCCGHGKNPGWITLSDGRDVTIPEAEKLLDGPVPEGVLFGRPFYSASQMATIPPPLPKEEDDAEA